MDRPTLLAVFAHPDDETLVAGTLARYAAEGARVILVCVTRGEAGEISEPHLATSETLGDVREGELREAATALGIDEPRLLGFRDSGMAGTPANEDPRSFHQADPEEATRRLVALIRELRPQVILTHDPTGGYGHPDHIAANRYVVSAFDAAADPSQYPETGAPWRADRLIYAVMPRSFFARIRAAMEASGLDTSRFDGSQWEQIGYPDDEIATTIDVSAQLDRKLRAINAHRTQFGPENPIRRMPPTMQAEAFGREHFMPALPPELSLPHDRLW